MAKEKHNSVQNICIQSVFGPTGLILSPLVEAPKTTTEGDSPFPSPEGALCKSESCHDVGQCKIVDAMGQGFI